MKQILTNLVKPRHGVYLLCILTLGLSTAAPSFAEGPIHTSKWLCDAAADAYDNSQISQSPWDWANVAIYYTAYVERNSEAMRNFPDHKQAVLDRWQESIDEIWDKSAIGSTCSKSEEEIRDECASASFQIYSVPSVSSEIHPNEKLLELADNAYYTARRSGTLWDWVEAARYYTAYIEKDPAEMYGSAQLKQRVLANRDVAMAQVLTASRSIPGLEQRCRTICPASTSRGKGSLQHASTSPLAPEYPYTPVYGEAFEDGQAQGWTLDQGWAVSGGTLAGVGHKWARYNGGYQWYDSRVRFRVRLDGGSGIHFNYRLSDQGRYFIGFREGGMYLSKTAPWGTTYGNLVTSNRQHNSGVWYNVEIVGKGPHIRVWVNDVKELDYTDPSPLLSGTIAFENLEVSRAAVDDIVVSVPYVEPIPKQQTFDQPTVDGYRLDWCYYNGMECGSRAATEWCKTKGFARALDFQVDPDVGQQGSPTKVLGTGTICNAPYCDSFKSITCTK